MNRRAVRGSLATGVAPLAGCLVGYYAREVAPDIKGDATPRDNRVENGTEPSSAPSAIHYDGTACAADSVHGSATWSSWPASMTAQRVATAGTRSPQNFDASNRVIETMFEYTDTYPGPLTHVALGPIRDAIMDVARGGGRRGSPSATSVTYTLSPWPGEIRNATTSSS